MPPLCILVVFLLNGVASPSPTRRTNPNSRVTPALVEGDIAVPERHLRTGQELSAFLADPSDLWPQGIVYYWIEQDEWPEGVFNLPVFTNEGVNNITQAFNQIMEAVPCIQFRSVTVVARVQGMKPKLNQMSEPRGPKTSSLRITFQN